MMFDYKDYVKCAKKGHINTDLSNKCILQCVYCARQTIVRGIHTGKEKVKSSSDMSLNDYQKVINTFEGISMCGQISDPIYHPNLIQYLQLASDQGCYVTIHTNGSGKKLSFWKQAFSIKFPIRWIFGIDGLDQKTCNLHRIGQNFHQSFKAMLLGAQSHHRIIWQYIPFQHNEHQIQKARDIARKYGIKLLLLKSNRWSQNTIVVNNKEVVPDWIQPPTDQSLSVQWPYHVQKQYHTK